MKGWLALVAVAVLSGCASLTNFTAPAPVQAQGWTGWVCDSGVQVLWREAGQGQVEVKLAEQAQVYRLKRQAGTEGELYSDGVLAFHQMAGQGLVYWVATNDLIGRGCKAP
jgi:uncharacterized protein YceK